jgi:hypothetical protein
MLLLAAAVHSIGKAEAYDILDIVGPLPPGPPPPRTVAAPPPAVPWSPGLPLNLRIEGGVGYSNGGSDTTISSPGIGSLSTDLVGGGGIAAEAALWSDGMLLPDISLGAQYLHFDNSGSVTVSSAAGGLLGVTSATAHLDLTTNALMVAAEWRPKIAAFHPFLGTGVGVAFTDLSGSGFGFSASDSQTALAGQAFLGFDYDIAPNVYVGVTGRFFISDATYNTTSLHVPAGGGAPVAVTSNIDVTNRPISLMAHIGVQF